MKGQDEGGGWDAGHGKVIPMFYHCSGEETHVATPAPHL